MVFNMGCSVPQPSCRDLNIKYDFGGVKANFRNALWHLKTEIPPGDLGADQKWFNSESIGLLNKPPGRKEERLEREL